MIPLIHSKELLLLQKEKSLIILDVRTGADAVQKYKQAHLAGALFVDLENDLSGAKTNPTQGGRHPLPTIQDFAILLGNLGIQMQSHVVVYDDKNGANAAARFWWMLRAAGHTSVQVLDGGYQAAIAAGVPTNSGIEMLVAVEPYDFKKWQLPTASITEVEQAGKQKDFLVIDVRDANRFRGETEPIDLVAGHIPGAVNIPFTSNLDEQGYFLPAAVLQQKYKHAFAGKNTANVIVHCGSGVTACHTLLAMAYAGFTIPKLYVGSWSEWSRSGRAIATAL